MSPRRLVFAAVLLTTLASGCAYLRAEYARGTALTQQLDAYVIAKPIAEVWPSVTLPSGPGGRLRWSEQGWSWSEIGPWKMRTSTKATKEKGAGGDQQDVVTWYEVEGAAVPGGTQVRYFEHTERTTFREGKDIGTQRSSNRRIDLELELVRHFDRPAADRIEAEGEKAAQAAK